MDMTKLVASIKAHEGLRLRPYNDGYGNLTIGFGRALSINGITNEEANAMLDHDIQSAIREAEAQTWWSAVAGNDARANAMVEMVFNMGAHRVSNFVNAIAAMVAGDWNAAADAFMDSKWAIQTKQRAVVLTEMIRTGQDT